MNENVCKYCHNFYSTLCLKCRISTGNPNDADFSCGISEKKVQKNWKAYEKATRKLTKIAGDYIRSGKELNDAHYIQ